MVRARETFSNKCDDDCPSREPEYTLLKSRDYAQILLDSIRDSKKRVWLQTMNFEHDHMSGLIVHNLILAAKRGIDVRAHFDGFSYMVTDGNLDRIPSLSKPNREFRRYRANSKRRLLKDLSCADAQVTITNWPVSKLRYFFPPVGRNHIKVSIIDDSGFLGGVNLSDKDFLREDTMLKIGNLNLVTGLEKAFNLSEQRDVANSILFSDKDNQLLFDGGTERSLILENVERTVLSATSSVIICTQFAPDSFLVNLIKKVKSKGLTVRLIVSDPQHIGEYNAWIYDRIDRIKAKCSKIEMSLFPGWLHAKIILTDYGMPNSQAVYGTHNFSLRGSTWHNQELTLFTLDSKLIEAFHSYLSGLVRIIDNYPGHQS